MNERGQDSSEVGKIWQTLETELTRVIGRPAKLVFPSTMDELYYKWFKTIEAAAFREELRYSAEEILERIEKPDLLFFFVTSGQEAHAFILGYRLETEWERTFYFDTIAVLQQGRGIGRLIMNAAMEWARVKKYRAIVLDTEEKNEKGLPLRRFYEKLGFILFDSDETGNLTMKLRLNSKNTGSGSSGADAM